MDFHTPQKELNWTKIFGINYIKTYVLSLVAAMGQKFGFGIPAL